MTSKTTAEEGVREAAFQAAMKWAEADLCVEHDIDKTDEGCLRRRIADAFQAQPSIGGGGDVSTQPPPHWTPEEKYDRHPKRAEDWNWRNDPTGPERLALAVRRLNFAGDLADPRAPDQMALVLRKDLIDLKHDYIRKNAGFQIWVAERKKDAALSLPAVADGWRDTRQSRVAEWCAAAFGKAHQVSVPMRALRHAEEALEAAQAAGCDRATLINLVDYIFNRPPGDLRQEIGASGLTLLALAAAAGVSADDAEQAELDRVLAKPLSHFAARNQVKLDAGFDVPAPTGKV